jgi:hypothetical protein
VYVLCVMCVMGWHTHPPTHTHTVCCVLYSHEFSHDAYIQTRAWKSACRSRIANGWRLKTRRFRGKACCARAETCISVSFVCELY